MRHLLKLLSNTEIEKTSEPLQGTPGFCTLNITTPFFLNQLYKLALIGGWEPLEQCPSALTEFPVPDQFPLIISINPFELASISKETKEKMFKTFQSRLLKTIHQVNSLGMNFYLPLTSDRVSEITGEDLTSLHTAIESVMDDIPDFDIFSKKQEEYNNKLRKENIPNMLELPTPNISTLEYFSGKRKIVLQTLLSNLRKSYSIQITVQAPPIAQD